MARARKIPKWLSAYAKDEWKRVVPLLADKIADCDLGSVEAYCSAVGLVRTCQETINREGITCESASGGVSTHPAVRIQSQAMVQVKNLAIELGLTPKSRKHSTNTVSATSIWDDVL